MKAESELLFRRGKRGTLYLRRRIPSHLRDAYPPNKTEFLKSLRTSDLHVAQKRLRSELACVDEQFERMRVKLSERWKAPKLQHVTHLSEQQLQDLSQSWLRFVLETDDEVRRQGLDDDDFQASWRAHRRAAFGARTAARTWSDSPYPAGHAHHVNKAGTVNLIRLWLMMPDEPAEASLSPSPLPSRAHQSL